jgi:hypothetical protein
MYDYELLFKWCSRSTLLQCPKLFCCFVFLFDPEAIIFHRWGIESKWLKNHVYEYQLIFNWCSWSILIITHVLNSHFGNCCNAHHYFAVLCSYLSQRPSFATGDKSSQNNWIITYKSTNLYLHGVAGLYWSYPMSWIYTLAVDAVPTTVLLYCVPIWPRGHHLPLVRNRIKVTEESHVRVPTEFYMV